MPWVLFSNSSWRNRSKNNSLSSPMCSAWCCQVPSTKPSSSRIQGNSAEFICRIYRNNWISSWAKNCRNCCFRSWSKLSGAPNAAIKNQVSKVFSISFCQLVGMILNCIFLLCCRDILELRSFQGIIKFFVASATTSKTLFHSWYLTKWVKSWFLPSTSSTT